MGRPLAQSFRAVKLALCIASASGIPLGAEGKTPGTTYCYLQICHRVLTLAETAAAKGKPATLVASYYDMPERDRFNPTLTTSSGELFQANAEDNAASPILPDGTRLLVRQPQGGNALIVRINNAGPYFPGRELDLSRGAAARLGLIGRGIGEVEVVVVGVPQPAQTLFHRGRTYPRVAGYLGRFDSLSAAYAHWRSRAEANDEPDGAAASLTPAMASADEPRIVVIDRRGPTQRQPSGARSRVVLLPVKLRRPLLLASIKPASTAVQARRRKT